MLRGGRSYGLACVDPVVAAWYPRRARAVTPFRVTFTVSLWNFPSCFCVEENPSR